MEDIHQKIKRLLVQDMEEQALVLKPIRVIMIKAHTMMTEKLDLGELKELRELKRKQKNLKETLK